MNEKLQKLEISADELAVIEAALHTQSKILNVQAKAGGAGARSQLNVVKRLLASVAQQKPRTPSTPSSCKPTWLGMSRIFG